MSTEADGFSEPDGDITPALGAALAEPVAGGMWCDSFDADLLAVVPGAAALLGSAAEVQLRTYSRLTNGKINHPSAWNTYEGVVSFFWTSDEHKPDASLYTEEAVAGCTFLEVIRDEWVHGCMVSVNGEIVWQPPEELMERLMYDLRGWTVMADALREAIRGKVRRSLSAAAERLTEVLAAAGSEERS